MKELCSVVVIVLLLCVIYMLYTENKNLKGDFTKNVTTIKEIFLNSPSGCMSNPIIVDGERCDLVTKKFNGEWVTYIFNLKGEANIIFSEYHKTKEDALENHFRILNGGELK